MSQSHSVFATHPSALERAIRAGKYRAVPSALISARVEAIRAGLSATIVKSMAGHMSIAQEQLYETLGLPRATMIRRLREGGRMKADESERVLGLASLIGQVEDMVHRSGDPKGFDAAKWVAEWLEQPLPALGGKAPAEWMDTFEGQRLVADTLSRMESGAYV